MERDRADASSSAATAVGADLDRAGEPEQREPRAGGIHPAVPLEKQQSARRQCRAVTSHAPKAGGIDRTCVARQTEKREQDAIGDMRRHGRSIS